MRLSKFINPQYWIRADVTFKKAYYTVKDKTDDIIDLTIEGEPNKYVNNDGLDVLAYEYDTPITITAHSITGYAVNEVVVTAVNDDGTKKLKADGTPLTIELTPVPSTPEDPFGDLAVTERNIYDDIKEKTYTFNMPYRRKSADGSYRKSH